MGAGLLVLCALLAVAVLRAIVTIWAVAIERNRYARRICSEIEGQMRGKKSQRWADLPPIYSSRGGVNPRPRSPKPDFVPPPRPRPPHD